MSDSMDRLDAALEGRYLVREKVGEGGMATVYAAEDLKHQRRVAIKVLKPQVASAVGADRFLSEIRTTANLQHPHILPLFDSGEADGSLFYVMPYVAGESLRARLDREGPLPVEEAVRTVRQLADALDYAHREGVVHRDLKPANVMLHHGDALLTDFGIALALGTVGGGRLTATGFTLGTPRYMSPEQATGEWAVGPPTDVWALGCILYETLVGESPFDAGTAQAVVNRMLTAEIAPPTALRSSVPPHVDAVARKALERLPADRFRTAGEMSDALADPSFRHGRVEAGPQPDRRRLLAVTGWVVAMVLAGVLAWTATRTDTPAELPLRRTSIPLPASVAAGNVVDPIAISPDGRRIAYVLAQPRELHLRELSRSSGSPVAGVGNDVGSITFSPDGTRIAFHAPIAREIRTVSSVGGDVHRVATGIEDPMGGLTWGEDGTIVFSASGSLWRVPAGGGMTERLTHVVADDPVRHLHPRLLPDGNGVAFTVAGVVYPWPHRVAILPFGGEITVVAEGRSPRVLPDGTMVFVAEPLPDGVPGLRVARLASDGRSLAGDAVTGLGELWNHPMGGRGTGSSYDLARDGTLVHLPASPEQTFDALVLVDRRGAETSLLPVGHPQLPREIFGLEAARFSPDGRRIAFRGSGGAPRFRLFVYDTERSVVSRIPVDANADWPVWTPDGRELVFNRFGSGEQNLYRSPVDRAGEPRPFQPPNEHQQHALAFTPEGDRLLIQHRGHPGGPDSDILVLRENGEGEPETVVDGPGLQYQAALSPDGRWMAYVSEASGSSEVLVTDFPAGQTRTKISTEAAFSPVWNPAGGEIFYRRSEDGAVMAVPVRTDDSFQPGRPDSLFAGPYSTCCVWGPTFDVDPSGEHFLLTRLRSDTLAAPRIEMVQGWLGHVRARLSG